MVNTKMNYFKLDYVEQFNCVWNIEILVCKQISSDSFWNKTTNKLLTYR